MLFENEIDQLLTQAETYLQEQKPVEALDVLDRARTLAPAHGWVTLFRGVALGQLGRLEEAITLLLNASDANPDDIDVQVDAARHLSLLEQHQDALICVNRAIALDANDAGAFAVQAEVMERMGRIQDALAARETAIALDPDDADSRYFLAVNLCDLGRYDDAYVIAEQLSGQMPDDPDVLRLNGACLSYLNHHQQALSKWAALERLEGLTPNLLHNRASTLDALGLHEEALDTINEAIATEPEMAMNYYTRGMIHEHLRNTAAALNDYLTALNLDPDHMDAAINLIELATINNIVTRAMGRLHTLLEQHPTSAKVLYALGRLQMETGEYHRARRTLEAAVRREPSLGIIWYTLSMLYSITNNPEDALHAADRALQDFPDDPGLWLNRGQALEEQQQFHQALECYDKAVALAPEDGAPWFQLGRLLLMHLKRPAAARGVLKEALRLQPDNDTLTWLLALCYLQLEQLDDAAREIRTLLSRSPNHAWGWVLRAAWHAQRDEMEAALADLRVASTQGYDMRMILDEPLFATIRMDTRFAELLNDFRGSRRE